MTAEPEAVELARVSAERMYEADAASRALGIAIEDVAPGRATASLRIAPHMVNGHGIAHGGYVFLLADTAFAFAANTYGAPAVARACEIEFLRPAAEGDELVATATERLRDGRSGIYDVTVRRADDEVVAELRGHSRTLRNQTKL